MCLESFGILFLGNVYRTFIRYYVNKYVLSSVCLGVYGKVVSAVGCRFPDNRNGYLNGKRSVEDIVILFAVG